MKLFEFWNCFVRVLFIVFQLVVKDKLERGRFGRFV